MDILKGEPLVAHGRVIPAPPEMGDGWALVVTEPVLTVLFIGAHSWLQTDELVRVRFVPGEVLAELILEPPLS